MSLQHLERWQRIESPIILTQVERGMTASVNITRTRVRFGHRHNWLRLQEFVDQRCPLYA
jgi:hypothetical protein